MIYYCLVILANNLLKKFGGFKAVDELNLEIKKGQCFGLLGPNGAGKSTFINMIYGAVLRTSGDLSVFDLDPNNYSKEIKRRIGVVTQENALDESLNVYENMMVYAAFVNIDKETRHKRVMQLLDYMSLSHKKEARIQSLSGGMKRRLVFVRALLPKPDLLILDEPTTGLDPAVRHLLWGKVKELHASGTTILLTTHYMHEAEVLCDDLVIMNQGKVVAKGSPVDLIRDHSPGYIGVFDLSDHDKIISITKKLEIDFQQDSSGFYLRMQKMEEISGLHAQYNIQPLQIRPANLEDVFLKLTGKDLSSDA